MLTTIHGYDEAQISERDEIRSILKFFETVIVLSKRNGAGTVESVREKAVKTVC